MILPPFPVACMCGHINKAQNIQTITCKRCRRDVPKSTVDAAFQVDQTRYRPSLTFDGDASALIEKVFGKWASSPA